MLTVLLNHNPAFIIGELMLGLSIGMFTIGLIGAVRDKYSVRVPAARRRDQSAR